MSLAQALDPEAAKVLSHNPPTNQLTSIQIKFCQMILMGPTVYMGRATVLALYHRIFNSIAWVRWSIYMFAIIGLILPIMNTIDAVLCSPPNGGDSDISDYTCSKRALFEQGLSLGVVSPVIDVFMLVLPIPIVAKLNIGRKKKVGVLLIFLTGTL